MYLSPLYLSVILTLLPSVLALSLTVQNSGGNSSSALLYGILYEDIYHSGDGGIYGELIRNRAFQGSNSNGQASTVRNTDYWHPIGNVKISLDQSGPALSSSLPAQMRIDIPAGTTGTVGIYNEGFWGFNVDASKRYVSSFYMRGDYLGNVSCFFASNLTGARLASTTMSVGQKLSDGWKQTYSPTFQPSASATNPNNTFSFTFDGTQLAGKSIYLNLFSVFKQTYNNRVNGMREDLAQAVYNMNPKYLRMPGGNNMEGDGSPFYWKWKQTIGDLKNRPGRPGTWGDINTDGFGLLEMMQWCLDMNLTTVLGTWAGLYLDGEIVPQADIQPYVTEIVNELEFLTGSSSTTYGSLRSSLGYPNPFKIPYIEIGNEDYLNGGTNSYYSYRYNAFYNALSPKYQATYLSTINPSPTNPSGAGVDLHIYGNEAYFVSLYNTFDQASRSHPVLVGEYACTNTGANNNGQVGAQTFGMACAEAIFLLGCERNSDIVFGTSYGALIKNYDEAPDTVAAIKHTANQVLLSMSYYVQQLFSRYKGSATLPVTASGGGQGPVYWAATQSGASTILKLVNYNGGTGSANAVSVTVQGSSATSATLITMTAPSSSSVNNLPGLGGESSKISSSTISGSGGKFSISFSSAFEIAILIV